MERDTGGIWIEKYRPKTLSDIVGQEKIVSLLKAYVAKKALPHLLFAGPPGTGKTTAALALARDLYGDEWKEAFLELNASVTPETPILIKLNGETQRTTMGDLAGRFFHPNGPDVMRPERLEILTAGPDGKVGFQPVSAFSRHHVEKVARITVEGGSVRTSLNHSVMVLDRRGRLVSVPTSELNVGDLLLSFRAELEGQSTTLDLGPHAPHREVVLREGGAPTTNPTVRTVLGRIDLDEDLSWTFGNYTAEGCASPTRTSGNVVFTHGYPQEIPETDRVRQTFERYGFHTKTHLTRSGYKSEPDGSPRYTSIQTALSSTQWMRFFRSNFYREGARKDAHTKAVPSFVYSAKLEDRLAFLEGYAGDAQGEWGKVLRYVSVSDPLLIDVAWLARMSGLESSFKDGWRETMVCWPQESSYRKSDLLPARPFCEFLEGLKHPPAMNWRYALRHSLYDSKSTRTLKRTVAEILARVSTGPLTDTEREGVARWQRLVQSDLYPLKVLSINTEDCQDYVYDVSVPGSEMFFGGTVPLLLHNSDERGIETVRTTIKNYARSSTLGTMSFKILFLDESDNLTSEAQASLRRLMERYASLCRFILSCNYSSRIIPPIQSRCAVFRFRPLKIEDMKNYLERIATAEGKAVEPEAYDAILRLSMGDMRQAVNILQQASAISPKVDADTVYESSALPLPKEVEDMLAPALKGEFRAAREKLYALLTEKGASGEDVLKAIHSYLPSLAIPDIEKVRLVDYLAEMEFRMVEGASSRIQLEALLARLALPHLTSKP